MTPPVETATRREVARRSRQEARDRIVAAATELVRGHSYAELNVEVVMREAGLGRTIFYRHFDDLGDLLLRVAQGVIGDLFEAQPVLEDIGPGDEAAAVRQGLEPAVEVYRRHGPILRAIAEAAASDPSLAAARDAMRAQFAQRAVGYLREAQARGAFALDDVEETAFALTVMTNAYLLEAFGREPRVSVEVAAQTVSEIWIAMVRS
jgi:TetR/AcrR family transcriptional regulator, ethionamide resistance regulator